MVGDLSDPAGRRNTCENAAYGRRAEEFPDIRIEYVM
jgi:hypothetical protein